MATAVVYRVIEPEKKEKKQTKARNTNRIFSVHFFYLFYPSGWISVLIVARTSLNFIKCDEYEMK